MRLAFLSIGRHIHTERWIRWFALRGNPCHLLTFQPGPVADVTVHDIGSGIRPKPLRYAIALNKVKQLLRTIKPDLLNTHFLTGYGYLGHFCGFHPNVLTVWGDDVYLTPFASSWRNSLARRALRSCEVLTGDSTDILARACGLGGDPKRSFRVLWGVDFSQFHPAPAPAFRRKLGFGPEDVVFFSPRSFTQPYYNIDTVIEAAARVRSQEPRARFLFSGYEGDPGPFRQAALAAGLGPVMQFLGRLSHRRFAEALRAVDVFISVPSVDATAVSLLEAMACGCAVVVSNLPSATEWITDGQSGLVVPPRDAGALAAALCRFGADPQLRRRCGFSAVDTAHRFAGFDTNMALVDQLYQRLVTGAGRWPDEVALSRLAELRGEAQS